MTAATRTPAGGELLRRQIDGTTLALAILGLSLAQALTPLARTVEYSYPALTVVATLYLLRRGRRDLALELDLWTWVVAPGLRRVVDWSSGSFNPGSPILATAALAALIIAVTALQPRRRWPLGFGFGTFVFAMAGAFAVAIGITGNGVAATAVSALLWFAPLGLGLLFLTAGDETRLLVTATLRFTRWALLVLSGYALLQWAVAPAWDVFWLAEVAPRAEQLGSPFGTPEPFGLRPSSTSNSPFVFAHLLVWLLVSQVGTKGHRRPVAFVGVALGCVALGLTGIRSAWLTAALVILVLALSRRIRLAPLAVTAGLAAYLLLSFVPTVAQTIGERLGTVQSATTDTSLLARLGTYTAAVPAFIGDPVGGGLGATGAGARANPQDDQAFEVLDSSYLEALRTAGAIMGGLAMLAVVAMSVGAFLRSRNLPPPYAAWGALALVVPIDMLLGGVISGPAAIVTWLVLGAGAGADADVAAGTADDVAMPPRPGLRSS